LDLKDIDAVKGEFSKVFIFINANKKMENHFEKCHLGVIYAYQIVSILEGSLEMIIKDEYLKTEFKRLLKDVKPVRDDIAHGTISQSKDVIQNAIEKLHQLREILKIRNR
jgi:hypothetical protein